MMNISRSTLAVALTLACASSMAIASQATDSRFIQVSGESSATVVADHYEIQVELVVRNADRSAVKRQLDDKRNALRALTQKLGVAAEDMGYTRAELQEEFKWQDNERQRIGFSMQESWWIKAQGVNHNGQLLAALAQSSAVDSYRSQPSVDGQAAYRSAMVAALQDAKAKAELMADTLNSCLGPVQQIQEQGMHSAPQPLMMKSAVQAEMADAPGHAQVSSQARVNVVWQLVNCTDMP